ncbi:HSP20-like chaperone [Neurospora crassa]|nr:HSP20-like chaperone [Neurospora crassa]
MSLFYPRSALSHPSSSLGNQPTFSSLFRMLDDFEKYAQQVSSGSLIPTNLGSSLLPSLPSTGATGSVLETFNPKFDVTEDDSGYNLQGELPGVDPKNVDIEFIDPQTLVISGRVERTHTEGDPNLRLGGPAESKKIEGGGKEQKETKETKETKEQKEQKEQQQKEQKEGEGKPSAPRYWLSERSYGEFRRVFNFPTPVDQDNVNAKFENGILHVKVPKSEKKGSRKISIQAGQSS